MPSPLSPEQIRARYNRQAEQYQSRYVGLKGEFYRRFEDRIFLEHLDVDGTRVLDLGTGRGRLALLLADRAREVVGLDVSDEMIKFANEAAAGRTNVRFERTDASKLAFDDSSFDVVTAVGMVPYVADVVPLFREVNRVCRDNGIFAFSAGNAREVTATAKLYEAARGLLRRLRGGTPAARPPASPLITHELAYLKSSLREAGFELITYESTFFYLPSRVFYRAGRANVSVAKDLAADWNEFLGTFRFTKPFGKLLVLFARKVSAGGL